ncbi:hypothetical protein B7R22_05430 [Subtercola boreus]|uniref:Replicative helicase inhibitor G39P N-terminal domain-containing protein n=1 Tax=Subtercola boreus TaxID=120213 RepID=A0A3E0W243_9MICO|nr:hypothetical protein [Subtercola boreus]RFA14577.1 hypothetical protein B7R21_06430 [Subtercola boreus]RFA15849.1 hypothetical protein B7R22_05430 [Subtercola boreus]
MNAGDVMELLTVAAIVNDREVPDALVQAWLPIVGKYTRQQGLDALRSHMTESPFFPKPSDIVHQVRVAVQHRREVEGLHPAPPAGTRWAADVIENDPRLKEVGQ